MIDTKAGKSATQLRATGTRWAFAAVACFASALALCVASLAIVAGVLGGELIRGYSDSQAPKGTPAGNISKDIQKSDPMSPDYLFGGLMAKAGLSNAGLDVGKVISGGLSQASQMVTDPFDAIFGTGHKAAAPAPLGKTPADLQGMTDTLGMAMATT